MGSTSTLGAPNLALSARRADQAKWCLMRLRCALVVMVAAWVVAACTSPHRTASRPVTTAPSASTAPPSSSAEPTPTTTGINPNLGADLPRCHTSQVTARVNGGRLNVMGSPLRRTGLPLVQFYSHNAERSVLPLRNRNDRQTAMPGAVQCADCEDDIIF